jgi:hypothetical protein
MAGVKSVELKLEGLVDLALVGGDDSVWLVVPLRWWDLATWVWWFMCPADRKAKVALTLMDGKKVNVKAVRVAVKHVRVRGLYK